jgi:RNA polymerase-binding protein DksA
LAKAKKVRKLKALKKLKAPLKKKTTVKNAAPRPAFRPAPRPVEAAVQPVKSKWNRKELEEFRKRIVARKDDILDTLGKDDTLKQTQKEASGDISGYTFHMADVATDNYDREFSLGLASNERELLYELVDALKRIEDGSYGLCEDCKGVITKTRLKAIPYTRHCLKCQEKRETR